MKIGLCVKEFYTNEIERNIQVIQTAIVDARKENIDLLCFGEAVLQGFFALDGNYQRDINIAIEYNSAYIKHLQSLASVNRIAIAFGYIERKNIDIYSSYMVIDSFGKIICNYNRISPGWKEPHFGLQYKEGENFGLFKFLNKSIAVGLCGDFWFDENKINKENIKSDLILWPVFIDNGYIEWGSTAINEYAGQAGKIGKTVFLVNSKLNEKYIAEGRAVHFEYGKIKSSLELNEEGILVCEI